MPSSIDNNFLGYLFNEKVSLKALNYSEEQEVLKIAKEFLFSGFLLNSYKFNKSNSNLLKKLKKHNYAFFLNYLFMKKSLLEITELFKYRKIDFVVLKGMAMNMESIYKPGIRQHRDIDLLVERKNIKKTYSLLKELKFKYANPDTSDNANFLIRHQLPPMVNDHGINLELHWRVTDVDEFEICPLTEAIIKNRKESNYFKDLYVPCLEGMIAHTLYHGIKHHKFKHGPIFLFDLAALFKYNHFEWPKNEILIKELGLVGDFKKSKRIIEDCHNENKLNQEIENQIKELFSNFDWNQKKDEEIYFFKSLNANLIKRFFKRLKNTSHLYQLPKTSLRFWFYLIRDIFYVLKKIKF